MTNPFEESDGPVMGYGGVVLPLPYSLVVALVQLSVDAQVDSFERQARLGEAFQLSGTYAELIGWAAHTDYEALLLAVESLCRSVSIICGGMRSQATAALKTLPGLVRDAISKRAAREARRNGRAEIDVDAIMDRLAQSSAFATTGI